MSRFYRTNRYIGVNAHLNSYLQAAYGMWSTFHAELIPALRHALDKTLPSNYFAIVERGLQISFTEDDYAKSASTRPDIAIFQESPSKRTDLAQHSTPTASIPLVEVQEFLSEEDILIRVGIHEADPNKIEGNLITTLELLSPANKPRGGNYSHYLAKRSQHLQAGINLIEIDFLHENHPIIKKIPSYPRREKNAFPYNILVTKPQPSYAQGKFDWFGVTVDKPLPIIPIPLARHETHSLDLQEVYNTVYNDVRAYHQYVDHDTLPVNFSAYSEADQQRILEMLEQIRAEA